MSNMLLTNDIQIEIIDAVNSAINGDKSKLEELAAQLYLYREYQEYGDD